MRLSPAVNRFFSAFAFSAALCVTAPAALFAQEQPQQQQPPQQINSSEALAQALSNAHADAAAQATPYNAADAALQAAASAIRPAMTQEELDKALQDRDSPQYKAHVLAKKAKSDIALFGMVEEGAEKDDSGISLPTPPEMENLQDVHGAHGTSYDISDEAISKQMALDTRRDAQREAALSYGARGGLAKRNYQIMERLKDYEKVLDGVFNFRTLLIKAPSGLLIEPPIVRETVDTMVIAQGGDEAAVADQVLKINRQAKIVSAPREWRQYLVMTYPGDIPPPPRVLWPKSRGEQAEWNTWVKQGWDAGYGQGEQIFETSLNRLVADYSGMVRYRMLLAQGKISQPYALHEDRGVTGGKNEMRVGDRALRITGPSQFLTGADLWNPADR